MKTIILTLIIIFISTFSYSQSVSIADIISNYPDAVIEKNEESALIFITIEPSKEDLDIYRMFIYDIEYHLAPTAVKSWLDIKYYPQMLQDLRENENLEETEPGVFIEKEPSLIYYVYTQDIYCILLIVNNEQ